MASKPAPSSTLLSALWTNMGLKLIALALGWGAWTLIQDVISYESRITDIPVEIRVQEPDWAVLDMSPQTVSVVFRGPQEMIWDMDRNRLSVEVDIEDVQARDATLLTLQPRHVRAPRGVRVISLDPPQVYFSLGQIGQTNLPIRATTTGELPVGFEIETIVYRPSTATLYGPKQRLASIETVGTAPIDLGGRVRSFERRVPLVVPADGWGARVEPTDVVVQFTVVERSATRDVADVQIRAMVGAPAPKNIVVWPDRASVVVEGGYELLDSFEPGSLLLFVNCEGLPAGATYQVPVQSSLPQGLRARSITPPIVEVTVE